MSTKHFNIWQAVIIFILPIITACSLSHKAYMMKRNSNDSLVSNYKRIKHNSQPPLEEEKNSNDEINANVDDEKTRLIKYSNKEMEKRKKREERVAEFAKLTKIVNTGARWVGWGIIPIGSICASAILGPFALAGALIGPASEMIATRVMGVAETVVKLDEEDEEDEEETKKCKLE